MKDKYSILKEYFGHSTFRHGQEEIVDRLCQGGDVLCIMPTGAGKSVCYQVPAMLFYGVTVVISPLISLMKDQVGALCQSGIPAAFLNSSLTPAQLSRALANLVDGKYKILYVAPERLSTADFADACRKIKIPMVAVDEAHCVSQWGQDFRPNYLKIVDFIEGLPERPVVGAFTATATDDVKADILRILKLRAPLAVTTGFDRPNLFFSVEKPTSKSSYLQKLIKERSSMAGIVYCATRKNVDEVCYMLCESGFPATRYHAGLTEAERRINQDDFVFDRKTVMVATNAFGMGIDKSNVAYVIHYNMPKNIESYYQEVGRAGRDGAEAECILLYSPTDVRLNKFLIEKSEENTELSEAERLRIRELDLDRLKSMTFYCTTNDCLRSFIIKYFGESRPPYCGKCSNCLTKFETVDITVEAQKILSCIVRTGGRYGKKMICDILRGSKNERILSLGLDRISTYGIMSDTSEKRVRAIIDCLVSQSYAVSTGDDYPVLQLTPSSGDVLHGDVTLTLKAAKEQKKTADKPKGSDMNKEVDATLLDALKALRREIAARRKTPAYLIFPDKTLTDMCQRRPATEDELLNVSGVGKAKLERYGKAFLSVIKAHSDS